LPLQSNDDGNSNDAKEKAQRLIMVKDQMEGESEKGEGIRQQTSMMAIDPSELRWSILPFV